MSQQVAPAQQVNGQQPAVELTEAEVEYNKQVQELETDILNLASDVFGDMKGRQLPDGVKGDKVYGPHSANRTHFNSLNSLLKQFAEIAAKLKKEKSNKKTSQLVGFAVPGYIDREMAHALGMKEGETPLWVRGGEPIFSAALITRFFTHRVMVHGLIHDDDISKFKSDELMVRLFSPYTVSSVKPGEPPIDLQNLTYTQIQQLIKNFVKKKSDQNPGPKINADTPEGQNLTNIFKTLEAKFKALGVLKVEVTTAMKNAAKAQEDLVKAKACLDKGEITQNLFNNYATIYNNDLQRKNEIYKSYCAEAKTLGI